MLVVVNKWRVLIEFASGTGNVQFQVSDQFYQNVLRKVAELEWPTEPLRITITASTPNTGVAQAFASMPVPDGQPGLVQ